MILNFLRDFPSTFLWTKGGIPSPERLLQVLCVWCERNSEWDHLKIIAIRSSHSQDIIKHLLFPPWAWWFCFKWFFWNFLIQHHKWNRLKARQRSTIVCSPSPDFSSPPPLAIVSGPPRWASPPPLLPRTPISQPSPIPWTTWHWHLWVGFARWFIQHHHHQLSNMNKYV